MVAIRIWDGCVVRAVMTVDQNGGSSFLGATGGAANSTPIDIDLDPWRGVIVDRRAPHPIPVSIREQLEGDDADD
jgi:hypothetical protein